MHQLDPAGPSVGTVILAHGMFSNYRSCRGLAKYLTTLNFECWLLDFQGHGYSDRPEQEPDFETMCLEDTSAVLEFFEGRSALPVWWVGHSGGGLAIAMCLARDPEKQRILSGVVTLASQASDAGFNWNRRVVLSLARVLVRSIGVAPGKLLGLGPENEFSRVMDQWLCWSLAGEWIGANNFDYNLNLSRIRIPSLSIAAVADRFIAPMSGCKKLYENLGGNDKTFIVCGKAAGCLEDYTHARVVSSRNASIDVWPVVGKWLTDHTESA